ncbi:hypothetical protein [Aeromicrobium phragmitis]|uniref:hypothetical protein n=1 Tax=Aeromicrobium phragmitis TaxID=2478914 RepID=UPI001AA092B9|nr:hypothetical protein [Aeromicrobium phragmitis]
MATGETGFDDVTFDLISVQYHALKAGHDYGQYVRDARNAGRDDIAEFFEGVMKTDAERAHRCHQFLAELGDSAADGPRIVGGAVVGTQAQVCSSRSGPPGLPSGSGW